MTRAKHPPAHGGKHVDGAVLSGTPNPDFSGTRIPYHQERGRHVTLSSFWQNRPLLTFLTEESFGFLLTRPSKARIGGVFIVQKPPAWGELP